MEVLVAIFIVFSATATISYLGRFSSYSLLSVSGLEFINKQFQYQVRLTGVAVVILLVVYFIDSSNFSNYLAFGDIAAIANSVPWLGISADETWLSLGISLAFFITLITFAIIYIQFRNFVGSIKTLIPYVPWVVLFSLSNSFSEEVVYRLGVIVPLAGKIDSNYIQIVSAVAFGLPHLRGIPSGILGAIAAGLLGWILTKSVLETHGIFWAWIIHFLQDLVIFSALVVEAKISQELKILNRF